MAKSSNISPSVLTEWMQRADQYARREPAKAVVSAFGAGFLLNLLPLGAIVTALVGVALSAVRPALFFLGLLKACEFCQPQTQRTSRHE